MFDKNVKNKELTQFCLITKLIVIVLIVLTVTYVTCLLLFNMRFNPAFSFIFLFILKLSDLLSFASFKCPSTNWLLWSLKETRWKSSLSLRLFMLVLIILTWYYIISVKLHLFDCHFHSIGRCTVCY